MKKLGISACYIVIGNILIAFAISTLVLEQGLVAGGVTGIGLVIHQFTGIEVSGIVALVNVVLFLIGLVFIGKKFALTTLLSSFLFPFFLNLFEQMSYVHGYCTDVLLGSVMAGCIIGIGIGLVLRAEASTGGTDILAILANRKLQIPIAIALNVIDFIFIVLQVPSADPMKVLYGLLVIFLTSFMLNKTLGFGQNLIQVMIFSDAYEAIRRVILKEVDAGVSLIWIDKGLTEINSKAVYSVIPHRKLQEIKRLVNQVDANAFIIISEVHEVNGKGYTLDRYLDVPEMHS